MVPPAFLQSPDEIDQIAQEFKDYERNTSIGQTAQSKDKDADDILEHMAKCTYCGLGKATIGKRDKIHVQLGHSSARILETLKDKESYRQAGVRQNPTAALSSKARTLQVQHNIVAYPEGVGIHEYVARLVDMFGVEELMKPSNPALQNVYVAILTAGNEMKFWYAQAISTPKQEWRIPRCTE